jgi:hypothetical protein
LRPPKDHRTPQQEEYIVNEQRDLATIARAFTHAWASQDMHAAADYLADDVTFDGPSGNSVGKQAYIEALAKFAQAVTGVTILAAFGDDSLALIMYDLATGPFGTLTSAELLTFREGKIAADKLTFDTFPIRGAGAGTGASGQPPAPPAAPASDE